MGVNLQIISLFFTIGLLSLFLLLLLVCNFLPTHRPARDVERPGEGTDSTTAVERAGPSEFIPTSKDDGEAVQVLVRSFRVVAGDTCRICFEELGTDRIILSCRHSFHSSCLERLRTSLDTAEGLKCPLCRHSLKESEDGVLFVE